MRMWVRIAAAGVLVGSFGILLSPLCCSLEENLAIARSSGHTRLPLCDIAASTRQQVEQAMRGAGLLN